MPPYYYDPFVLPFTIGVLWLFGVVIYKWIKWFVELPAEDKGLVGRNIFTTRSLKAIKEIVLESLLHRSIWRTNPALGFMHTALALGWFLLIVVGKLETSTYIKDPINLPHLHVFFRYFFPEEPASYVRHFNYALIMDALLIYVLVGVGMAWFKRLYSRAMGMRRTTRHKPFDRIAMTTLWLIFPLRYLAESVTSGVHDSGSFFTGGTGDILTSIIPVNMLAVTEYPIWWAYSIALGLFFISMPYSRYMHIFTEVPLIFLRNYRVHNRAEGSSMDNFAVQACSRCGICLDVCPIASELNINDTQASYFLRDRRAGSLTDRVANTCLMCGRCTDACPVGIELDTLRLSSRVQSSTNSPLYAAMNYDYLPRRDHESASTAEATGAIRVGFFAGCMTRLTPIILRSMEKIFAAAGVEVVWLDREESVCCGRPMRLAGNLDAAARMVAHNRSLIVDSGVHILVTGCPICYKSFTAEYDLPPEVRVLHHSRYIAELIASGQIRPNILSGASYVFHDSCEMRGITAEPRYILSKVALLHPTAPEVHCCGGSLANLSLDTSAQSLLGRRATTHLEATGAGHIATACPQCKKSIARATSLPVSDLSEVVAAAI